MRRLLLPLLIPACLATLVLLSFGPALFRGEQFAYRDAAHFYYPLYQRVQQEWQAGRWPLWEPEENGGMPLLGNPTAAVLYPGKLIYAALPYPWAARAYIVAHVLLAYLAMLALMRSWGSSWAGSGLAALSYAFAAPVLFQYCNVIFLVGAAWLPLGFRAADRWLRLGRRWALCELAAVLAMQVLGGDPEAAYVLGLCAGGYALGLAWRRDGQGLARVRPRGVAPGAAAVVVAWVAATLAMARWAPSWRELGPPPRPLPWMGWFHGGILAVWALAGLALLLRRLRRGPRDVLGTMLLGLAGAAILAAALAAAQLLPVLEFTGRSLRAAGGIASHEIFAFSLEPLRLAGLLWPNFYGDIFAQNRSWFALLPPTDKHATVWVPSLYLGGLTLVLALGAAGFQGGPPWRAWLTAVAGVTLCASLGDYSSPLWWARWVPALAHAVGPHDIMFTAPIRLDGYLRDGDGGVYWLLASFLPGFGQFRFPSKLLTFTTLALTALGGLGWDRLAAAPAARRTARLAAALLGPTLVGLALAVAGRGWIVARFTPVQGAGRLSSFGPLDAAGAYGELRFALAQGAVVLALAWALALHAWRRPALAAALALMTATADLALANTRYVLTVPQRLMEAEPKVLRVIAEAERQDPAGQPFRVHRMPLWDPFLWYEEASEDRVRDFVIWERDTLQPKYGLPYGVQYTLTVGTTELYDYEWFFAGFYRTVVGQVARSLGLRPGDKMVYLPRRGIDLWNTRYFILPADPRGWQDEFRAIATFLDQTERIYPAPDAFEGPQGRERRARWMRREDLQVYRNKAAYPRAWVVHRARFHRAPSGLEQAGRAGPLQELLYADDPFWHDPHLTVFDPKVQAWVEDEKSQELADYVRGGDPHAGESVTITGYTPQRVELEAVLQRPGLVILADVYYPGWKLTIDGQPAEIIRTNFLMRGAAVPAGRHRLVYTYRPRSFVMGCWASVAGLAAWAALAAWSRRQSKGVAVGSEEQSGQ